MCRAIARVGPTRKKGVRVATERDEFERAVWRMMVAEEIDPERLDFVDECGTYTSLAPLYGYAPKGERLRLSVPAQASLGQKHHSAFEHDGRRDETFSGRGRGDHRGSLRGLRGAGAGSTSPDSRKNPKSG
jgi:hypothetical protein